MWTHTYKSSEYKALMIDFDSPLIGRATKILTVYFKIKIKRKNIIKYNSLHYTQ